MPVEVPLIDVERQKGLADEVASRTGIEHESLQVQVIVLHNELPVYAASHWNITGEDRSLIDPQGEAVA